MKNGIPASERFVPVTPAGSIMMDLASPTEAEAWCKLVKAAHHMPYKTKENLVARGYTVQDAWTWTT